MVTLPWPSTRVTGSITILRGLGLVRTNALEDRRPFCVDRLKRPIVEIHSAVGADQTHVIRGEASERLVQLLVGVDETLVQFQSVATPLDDLIDIASKRIPVFDR